MKRIIFTSLTIAFSIQLSIAQWTGTTNLVDNIWRNGKVGIGIAPTAMMSLQDANSPNIDFYTGVNKRALISTNDHELTFQTFTGNSINFAVTNGSIAKSALYIGGNNNYIGIGTSTPTAILSLQDANSPNIDFYTGLDKRALISSNNHELTFQTFTGNSINFAITNGSVTKSVLYIGGSNSYVGIGTYTPSAMLDVRGTINACEVKVALAQGCDFVFNKDYRLLSIQELDNFIKLNKHLPNIAPASKMENEGINLSEMNAKLLQKIEEQSLYIIDLNKRLTELEKLIKK